MDTVDSITLEQISDRYFGWHDTHFSRVWEYPWVANQLDLRPGVSVLDAGAGRSPLPFFCAESGAKTCTVDSGMSEWEGTWGYFDYSTLYPAIISFNTDFCHLPWAQDSEFDFIICVSVIEHMSAQDRRKTWSEFKRILKSYGKLVLTIDLQLDGFTLWNRCRNLQVESSVEHGGLDSLLQELWQVGFQLSTYELCPLVSDMSRTCGLVLIKANEGKSDILISPTEKEGIIKNADTERRIVFGCVADNNPKYLSQALRLLQSIRWFGGTLADSDVIICAVDEIDSTYSGEFEQLGALVRVVPRFCSSHPPSNKLQFFQQPELDRYDIVVLLDCDTLVVQDPTPWLSTETFGAKIADLPTVPLDIFRRLFQHFGLPLPPEDYRTTFNQIPTIWYCNSGVLVFPINMLSGFITVWRDHNSQLLNNLELLGPHEFFCEQASLSLAFAAHPVPFTELPVCMNLPLHLTNMEALPEIVESDPVIMHYHDRVDALGYLLPSSYSFAQQRIELFNSRLRESRQKDFNNRLFWDFRYSQFPELGSGIGSRGETLILKRELLRDLVGLLQPTSILDVGCGDMATGAELSEAEYTGIDISPIVIQQNQERMPARKFICGDFLALDVKSADFVICLDVLIHLSDWKTYEAFVERLVNRTNRWGLLSGYSQDSKEGVGMCFYHEPLETTLRRFGVENIRKVGQYDNTTVLLFERGSCPQSSNALLRLCQRLNWKLQIVDKLAHLYWCVCHLRISNSLLKRRTEKSFRNTGEDS